jgi:hypothetical protein
MDKDFGKFESYLERASLACKPNQLSRMNLAHCWYGCLRLALALSGLPCGKGLQKTKKAILVVKKRHRTPISSHRSVSCRQPMALRVGSSFDLASKKAAPKISFDLASAWQPLVSYNRSGNDNKLI